MTTLNQEALQLIQKRQSTFNFAQLGAIYEYSTDLPILDDGSGDGIGKAIITELIDRDQSQEADEVLRRLERVVGDVISFSRAFQAIYYGHLEVEAKLEDINQILSTLTEVPLDLEAGLNQAELAQIPGVIQSETDNLVSLPEMLCDEELGEPIDIDFMKLLAEHLVEGQVAVVIEVGSDKMRSLTGRALAVNSQGEQQLVDLIQIYDLARSLGKTVTHAFLEWR